MENKWKSASHNKYLLQYHLIYVCKYRKKLLVSPYIADDVKRLSAEICNKHRVNIKYMETDKDHIHYMIETRPNINIPDFIRTMKGYISYHIWDKYSGYLLKQFWKESTFWTDGYFICSVGNVSEKTLKEYIEHQGQEVWSCIKQSNIGYILQNYNQSNLQRHLVVVVRYGILCSMIR